MARHSRPKPDEVVQVCYGIHPQTKEVVVTIFGRRNGSYSLGNHTYSNQHNLPIEAEVNIIHGIEVEFCVLAHQMNHENTKSMVAALSEKAARLKQ
jgi:hypothetical protein